MTTTLHRRSIRLSREAEKIQLLFDLILGTDFLDLRILQFLATGLPHLKLLNGAHLLQQTTDLLVVRIPIAGASNSEVRRGALVL